MHTSDSEFIGPRPDLQRWLRQNGAPVSRALARAVCFCTGLLRTSSTPSEALGLAFRVSNQAEAEGSQKASAVSKRQTVQPRPPECMYVLRWKLLVQQRLAERSHEQKYLHEAVTHKHQSNKAHHNVCIKQQAQTVSYISKTDVVSTCFVGSDSFCSCRSDCLPLTCWLYGCPICFGCT